MDITPFKKIAYNIIIIKKNNYYSGNNGNRTVKNDNYGHNENHESEIKIFYLRLLWVQEISMKYNVHNCFKIINYASLILKT